MEKPKTAVEKPKTAAEKSTRTVVDTISFTVEECRAWIKPEFQRDLKINAKVRALATQIAADGGVVPGVLTLGILNGLKYIVDGMHRREAFILSGKPVGYADVRICFFPTMAEMGEEFDHLNSPLVRMRPDDRLRGMEGSLSALQKIRKACPWIGYTSVRRGTTPSGNLSMSVSLRIWAMSALEVPASTANAPDMAKNLNDMEADRMIEFFTMARSAWGEDAENGKLYGTLNLAICAWLYRRVCINKPAATSRVPHLTKEQFRRGLLGLSASADYNEWLIGRTMGERDRSPAYGRVKAVFTQRLKSELPKSAGFPQPSWSSGSGNYYTRKETHRLNQV